MHDNSEYQVTTLDSLLLGFAGAIIKIVADNIHDVLHAVFITSVSFATGLVLKWLANKILSSKWVSKIRKIWNNKKNKDA